MANCRYCGRTKQWRVDENGFREQLPCICDEAPPPRPPAHSTAALSIGYRPDAQKQCPVCKGLVRESEWPAHTARCGGLGEQQVMATAPVRVVQAAAEPETNPSSATVVSNPTAPSAANATAAQLDSWLRGSHYTLVLYTHIDGEGRPNIGRGPSTGRYYLWAKDGRERRGQVVHASDRGHDEAEYLTLQAALHDLLDLISAAGRDPGSYTLTVYSRRELVVKQLTGEYLVKGASLRPVFAPTQALLSCFQRAELIWEREGRIKTLFRS